MTVFQKQNKLLQDHVQNKTSKNFKISVTCVYRYVSCEMNGFFFFFFFFFEVFINQFLKIHRSILCKIMIDLLYFSDVYGVNVRGKSASQTLLHRNQAQARL